MEHVFVFLANFFMVGLKLFNANQSIRHHYAILSVVCGAICLVWIYGTVMVVGDPFTYGFAYLLGAMTGGPTGSWLDKRFFGEVGDES